MFPPSQGRKVPRDPSDQRRRVLSDRRSRRPRRPGALDRAPGRAAGGPPRHGACPIAPGSARSAGRPRRPGPPRAQQAPRRAGDAGAAGAAGGSAGSAELGAPSGSGTTATGCTAPGAGIATAGSASSGAELSGEPPSDALSASSSTRISASRSNMPSTNAESRRRRSPTAARAASESLPARARIASASAWALRVISAARRSAAATIEAAEVAPPASPGRGLAAARLRIVRLHADEPTPLQRQRERRQTRLDGIQARAADRKRTGRRCRHRDARQPVVAAGAVDPPGSRTRRRPSNRLAAAGPLTSRDSDAEASE